MSELSLDDYLVHLRAGTAVIAGLVDGGDLTLPVPTCPDWTLRQLATHVGRAHRWAALIAATRSPEFIPFREVPDGRFPDDAADQAGWLTAGPDRLAAAVTEAGADPVWALGTLAPASFWGRRMCHETLVHRVDAQLAAGRRPEIEPALAADAADEFLTVLSGPAFGLPDPRLAALAPGGSLGVRITDGPDGLAGWVVRHEDGVITVDRAAGDELAPAGTAGATLTGPAERVLLTLVRRGPADDPAITVSGDRAVLTGWLAATPF